MKNKFLFFFTFFVFVPLIGCVQSKSEIDITVTELNEQIRLDSTLVILDVRTEAELSGVLGKIDGAINIPVQELNKRINELEKYKNNNIAVICRSGNRSVPATKTLRSFGFKAKNVLGGMKAWNADVLSK
jgi:rhodanese-related sulfurtransferase